MYKYGYRAEETIKMVTEKALEEISHQIFVDDENPEMRIAYMRGVRMLADIVIKELRKEEGDDD